MFHVMRIVTLLWAIRTSIMEAFLLPLACACTGRPWYNKHTNKQTNNILGYFRVKSSLKLQHRSMHSGIWKPSVSENINYQLLPISVFLTNLFRCIFTLSSFTFLVSRIISAIRFCQWICVYLILKATDIFIKIATTFIDSCYWISIKTSIS